MPVVEGDDNYDSDSLASSSSSQGSFPGDSQIASSASDNDRKKHQQPRSLSTGGLSKTLQRQLLRDIERNGGIVNISLQTLCNKKSDIYGSSSSSLRRSVQNKVSRWKKLSKHNFNLIRLELIGANDQEEQGRTSSRGKKPPAQATPPQTKDTAKRQLVFESPPPFFTSPSNMNNTNKTAMAYIDRAVKERNFGKHYC